VLTVDVEEGAAGDHQVAERRPGVWPAQKENRHLGSPGPGDAPSELIGSRKLLKRTLPGATTAAGSTIDHAWNDQYSPLYGVASPSSGCSPQTITLPRCGPFGISAMWMAFERRRPSHRPMLRIARVAAERRSSSLFELAVLFLVVEARRPRASLGRGRRSQARSLPATGSTSTERGRETGRTDDLGMHGFLLEDTPAPRTYAFAWGQGSVAGSRRAGKRPAHRTSRRSKRALRPSEPRTARRTHLLAQPSLQQVSGDCGNGCRSDD